MVVFTNNSYYRAMDQFGGGDVIEPLSQETQEATEQALNFSTELGTTTNPMQNVVESVKSKIMEGTARLEIGFIGTGKSNSQQPSPEAFGTRERADIREMLTINDIKASVHAAVHGQSIAGFGKEGFNGQVREDTVAEIKRAIDFAGDTTKGGAIVFHLSEWQRPMIEAGKNFEDRFHENGTLFKGYASEKKDAPYYVVDDRTGRFVEGISRDQKVYEPEYHTAQSFCPEMIGQKDNNGRIIHEDDWVDLDYQVIPKDAQVGELFNRVPIWDKENTNFKVAERDWNYFVEKASEWNDHHPDDQLTPEVLYARTKIENNILQAKGNSLYHGMRYEQSQKDLNKFREALEFYKKLEAATPEKDHWRLKHQIRHDQFGLTIPDNVLPSEYLSDQLKMVQDSMRHVHEASASFDAQAMQLLEQEKHLASMESYGLQKTAEGLAEVGILALQKTKQKNLPEPLYAAPENWDQHLYGSHPNEMKKIIEASREEMAKRLHEVHHYDLGEAKKLANLHIKGTLDIGHMNLWRRFYNPSDASGNPLYNNPEDRDKAFDKWLLKETETLVKDGYIKHIHLTDNFGYGDEHITPGQGNVPMKEFLQKLKEHDVKDIIVEAGSYNGQTIFGDTLSMMGSPIYGVGRQPRFHQVQHRHFGYNAPPFFIGGAYVPSNDWKPWTEVPLE